MKKIIFHIDVNSAYLSWTAVERQKRGGPDTLDIRTIPAIIGGDISKRRGRCPGQVHSGKKVRDHYRRTGGRCF